MEFKSFGHSMNVTRRFLPMTTVTGPCRSFTVCRVNFFTSACGEGGTQQPHCHDRDRVTAASRILRSTGPLQPGTHVNSQQQSYFNQRRLAGALGPHDDDGDGWCEGGRSLRQRHVLLAVATVQVSLHDAVRFAILRDTKRLQATTQRSTHARHSMARHAA